MVIKRNSITEACPSPATKESVRQEALKLLQRAPFLIHEIQRELRLTRGQITWRTLTAQVRGSAGKIALFSPTTLKDFVTSLLKSEYQKTYLHPKLTTACKQRRYDWSRAFYLFWETAMILAPRVQTLLLHMDEKWFFCVPFLGVIPVHHVVHHKSHIDKLILTSSW
jgi:hypothetical protein